MSTIKQNRKKITIGYCVLVLPEGRGAQGGEETPSPESAAAVVCLKEPSTSASRTHGMGGSGRVLTDGVPETQRDTTDALKVIADELKKISVVLCDIASTLKVKK